MKNKILGVLRNNTDYVSGQILCDRIGVSRTAVWKAIKSLKEMGYEIDSVNNKGYKLLKSPDIMTEDTIASFLKTKWLGKNIVYYEETDSTNTRAKYLGEEGAETGTVIFAETQNKGKGRRGKSWIAPSGTGIWMSLLLYPKIDVKKVSMLTVVSAMAVVKGLQENGIDCEIKWPNDIVMNKKKICGILTEISTEIDYANYVVVGIGINANIRSFPEDIKSVATSIYQVTEKQVVRAKLAADVLKEFEECYEAFLKTEDVSFLVNDYNQVLANAGNEIKLVENEKTRILKAIGIDETGALLVKNEVGKTEKIIAGEVSVRGLYGYV